VDFSVIFSDKVFSTIRNSNFANVKEKKQCAFVLNSDESKEEAAVADFGGRTLECPEIQKPRLI